MSIKHIRDAARQALHDHMAESATHRALSGADTPCTVRIHLTRMTNDIGDLGGLSGVGNAGFASTSERAYKAVFLRSEITPRRGELLITDDFTFRIEHVYPPYGLTIDADLELTT